MNDQIIKLYEVRLKQFNDHINKKEYISKEYSYYSWYTVYQDLKFKLDNAEQLLNNIR